MISIVIPTYGRDAVLVDSIRQLLALAVPADEVLVMDQTPTHEPETDAALSGWDADGRIRWIRHQPPGVVGAMNRGLREAKGDLVLFLDDDIVPDANLVVAHRQAYVEHPEAWSVVGQVMQGEHADHRPEIINRELNELSELSSGERFSQQLRQNKEKCKCTEHYFPLLISLISKIRGLISPTSALRKDLDFDFSGEEPAWVENVMAGNLSVRRERALAMGGFDENFVPPVSFRFETDFARRIVAAGGKIRFEPAASILHLRVPSGGTRSKGGHMASGSPLHGVGDYYYALKHGRGWDRVRYMARRPFREVCTKFHLLHPWWIPVKFVGELRAMWMAGRMWGKR